MGEIVVDFSRKNPDSDPCFGKHQTPRGDNGVHYIIDYIVDC